MTKKKPCNGHYWERPVGSKDYRCCRCGIDVREWERGGGLAKDMAAAIRACADQKGKEP